MNRHKQPSNKALVLLDDLEGAIVEMYEADKSPNPKTYQKIRKEYWRANTAIEQYINELEKRSQKNTTK